MNRGIWCECGQGMRSAFWLALGLLQKGERARGAGWVARARRLLEDSERECVERGAICSCPPAWSGSARATSRVPMHVCEAAELAGRFGDTDLAAVARHSRGRVLIRMGETAAGVRLLDEAMAAVDAGDVSPIAAGDVYCSLIEGCFEIFDVRRAQEWTTALTAWCESQADLVPYRGQCCVRRAEVLQLHGAWRMRSSMRGRRASGSRARLVSRQRIPRLRDPAHPRSGVRGRRRADDDEGGAKP